MSLANFELVIPTYNRPDDLRRNLEFHESQDLPSRILVLDSSNDIVKAKNRATIANLELNIELIEYDSATHPFDKFADGISRVKTEFCALCADDDLLIIDGLIASVYALEHTPDASVAHGYYFLFGQLLDRTNIDITTMLYSSPSIDDNDPMQRLNHLMQSYQALTYGVFRSDVLKAVYEKIGGVSSLMFRELISSALPVLAGKAIRVPHFFGARAHATGDDAQRTRWHPLEWFMRDSKGLLEEYASYRDTLADFALERNVGNLDRAALNRCFDVVHAGYLFKHMSTDIQNIVLKAETAGRSIDDYFNDQNLQHALIEQHNSELSATKQRPLLVRRIASAFPPGAINLAAGTVSHWPLSISTYTREYRFHESFLDNKLSETVAVDAKMLKSLVNALDLYQFS